MLHSYECLHDLALDGRMLRQSLDWFMTTIR